MYKYHAVLHMTSNDWVVYEWIRSKIIRENLTLTFHFVMRTSCYLLLILRGYTLMLGTTSDKQISRTFQGFAKDKLQFSRTDIYSINRHSLTVPFWTSYWLNHVTEWCIILLLRPWLIVLPSMLLSTKILMENDWVWLTIVFEVQRQPLK